MGTELAHTNDCITCHVRISQNSDTRMLKDADVPISTCIECHGTGPNGASSKEPKDIQKFWGSAIANEIASRRKSLCDKTPVFQCTYCHATTIGRYPVPQSHIVAVPPGREKPCSEK